MMDNLTVYVREGGKVSKENKIFRRFTHRKDLESRLPLNERKIDLDISF